MLHRPPTRAAIAALLPLLACVPQPVTWEASRPLAGADAGAVVQLDPAGAVRPVVATAADYAPPGACPGSVRVAVAAGAERYAVWWAPLPDSSARLLAAHSSDGGASWPDRYVVDSLDRGARGCRRAAPAIAADSTNGYVHVSYPLDAPEGEGIFYAHLMDPRAQFEVPVPIVYGDGPGVSAVASDDQHLAVAYENPNSGRPQVTVAVSRTAGHSFEDKAVNVSGSDTDAAAPRVAVRGARLAVAWSEGERVLVRTGAIK